MSVIGNIVWNLFDHQATKHTHQEAQAANSAAAKEELHAAGAWLASPFVALKDAWADHPAKASGWAKFGWGLASLVAAPFLLARGLIGGSVYGLMALKNGVVDN